MNYPKPIHFCHVCESPISFPMNKKYTNLEFCLLAIFKFKKYQVKARKMLHF